eukprot:TRINITY_DN2964_c0_g1_i2.p1 TRINITY_DN2964_c0_g1~~TRINITY_DN2964_c0_g1_i2.p1  ORF type:complete len:207 (+),score=43.09 TRINITY_DN2964_c0_g1_i2:223-843(+)
MHVLNLSLSCANVHYGHHRAFPLSHPSFKFSHPSSSRLVPDIGFKLIVSSHSRNISSIRKNRTLPLQAQASSDSPSSSAAEKWTFEFIGDGNSSHIGKDVSPPNSFEVLLDVAIVGRLPDKADIVIPVATVSGAHARLEKKEGDLFVTDMNSTNGTYVDDMKLPSGTPTAVSHGSCVTFGDVHLASFQISKIEAGTTSDTSNEEAP